MRFFQKWPLKYIILIGFISAIGCQSILRKPASLSETSGINSLQKLTALTLERQKLEHDRYLYELTHKPNNSKDESLNVADTTLDKLNEKIRARKNEIEKLNPTEIALNLGSSSDLDTPLSAQATWDQNWRQSSQDLLFRQFSDFPLDKDRRPLRTQILKNRQSTDYFIHLKNTFFSRKIKLDKANSSEKMSQAYRTQYLKVQLTCDQEFSIKKTLSNKLYLAGSYASFNLYDEDLNADRVTVFPNIETKECFIYFQNPDDNAEAGLRLVAESSLQDPYENLQTLIDGCALPQTNSLTGVEKFFLSSQYNSMSCPMPVQNIQFLSEPKSGLQHKFRALMGYDLSMSQIDAQNPYFNLDFSKAPKLDAIYLSYLVFRADFYGTLLSRLLEYHAQQGTAVKVLVSEVLQTPKDRELLFGLAAKYPNFQIQEFQYESPSGETIKDKLDQLHRTNHVKMFATLSKSVVSNNVVIIGGRNIHDGFVFTKPLDHSAFPAMVNYLAGEDSWASWRDFEAEYKDKNFAERVAAHFLTLWNRDVPNILVRSLNVNLRSSAEANANYFNSDTPLIRHIISIPYRDDFALSDFFADMVSHAQKKILMSTPYFRPTEKMVKALTEAVARGVSITLITRLDLKGDTSDYVISEANKESVNRFLNKINMLEYTEPDVILHTKSFLIDDKLTFMGSVNLNKRSFYHDLENGLLIYSPSFNQKMRNVLSVYMKQTRPIDKKLKVKLIPKIILKAFDTEF